MYDALLCVVLAGQKHRRCAGGGRGDIGVVEGVYTLAAYWVRGDGAISSEQWTFEELAVKLFPMCRMAHEVIDLAAQISRLTRGRRS